MREKSVLFSAPMVRALLNDSKTQTRRVLSLPKDRGQWEPTTVCGDGSHFRDGRPAPLMVAIWNTTTGKCIATSYQAGDRLYVREAWRTEVRNDEISPRNLRVGVPVYYEAGGGGEEAIPECAGRFRQGMHMPRWASRLTLIVTEVRVQRLQEISEADAIAEGINSAPPGRTAVVQYLGLWDGLNAARGYGWDTNPWVAAYTFAVRRGNIDRIEPV